MSDQSNSKISRKGLTYDDVLLVPRHSSVLPREVDLSVHLASDLQLNIPILSAAMDTVSEYKMAIALAREGGMAILHKNMSIEEQSQQIKNVKKFESGMVIDPITISPDED
ncbi:MAG: IMP dehydrogenase, partial [Bacteroidetes bacterium]|nr:IMP dehydrogenase [Bacteroidota bacterium]